MSYIPKSKIIIKNTSGQELMYKISKEDYAGEFIETSGGKFYAGNNTSDLSTELIKNVENANVDFGDHPDVLNYKNIKTAPSDFLKKTNPVIGTKPKPTNEDYKQGWFNRYFIKKHNSNIDYIEIDEKTYVELYQRSSTYDWRLYEVGEIQWALEGNVEGINKLNIKNLNKRFPFLSNFFPILNEYQKGATINITQDNTPQTSFSYQYPTNGSSNNESMPSGGGGGGY